MRGGNKRAYILKQICSWKLQVCLSVHDNLVSPGVKMDQDQSQNLFEIWSLELAFAFKAKF